MKISEHLEQLEQLKERLTKAREYKTECDALPVLLGLIDCQICLYATAKQKRQAKVNDFGGLFLINNILNEWESKEQNNKSCNSQKNNIFDIES